MQDVPATDRVAGDHGDDRLGQAAYLYLQVEHVEPPDSARSHGIVADVAVLAADALVAARAEGVRALAGKDYDADLRIVARLVKGPRELEERLGPECVAHLGATYRQLRDPARLS